MQQRFVNNSSWQYFQTVRAQYFHAAYGRSGEPSPRIAYILFALPSGSNSERSNFTHLFENSDPKSSSVGLYSKNSALFHLRNSAAPSVPTFPSLLRTQCSTNLHQHYLFFSVSQSLLGFCTSEHHFSFWRVFQGSCLDLYS